MLGWLNEQLLNFYVLPIHIFFIILELWYSRRHHQPFYTLRTVWINVIISLLYIVVDLPVRLVGLYWFQQLQLLDYHHWISKDWVYWFSLFIFVDLLFWILHFAGHHIRIMWAGHSIHHSSDEFNMATNFRASIVDPIFKFLFFSPLALWGYDAMDIWLMFALTQVYGLFLHTRYVAQLPVWDWIFVTPGHHRVHHATNVIYLDKNFGMVLIIWDRMFGTFQKELPEEEVRFGVLKPIRQDSLVDVLSNEFVAIGKDVCQPISLKNKLLYIFGLPGWSHDNSRKTSYQMQKEHFQQQNSSTSNNEVV